MFILDSSKQLFRLRHLDERGHAYLSIPIRGYLGSFAASCDNIILTASSEEQADNFVDFVNNIFSAERYPESAIFF